MSELELDESIRDMALGQFDQPAHVVPVVEHGLYVKFYMGSQLNTEKSNEEGRPCYDDLPCVQIMVPGDKSSKVDRPVRLGFEEKDDNNRFAREYNLFLANKEQVLSGTPLKEWPVISSSQIKELEYFNVFTLEHLAGISDSVAQKFMGANRLRDLAKVFLDKAKDGAPLVQMQAALAKRDEELENIRAQLSEVIDELRDSKKSKRKTAT